MLLSRSKARLKRTVIAGAVASLVVGVVASCSLDLNEGLIGAVDGSTPFEVNSPDAPVVDGGVDTGIPTGPDAAVCTNDDPCKTTHACLKGKCDLSRKKCVYDVCRPDKCQTGACDVAKAVCAPGTPYKYLAGKFNIGQLSAGGARGIAAVHPFLFINTPTGVAVFNVSNPAATTPTPVPLSGLGFIPSQMVASGSRVWFFGGAAGPGPSRWVVAYADVPPDPFVPRIEVTTRLITSTRGAEGYTLFPRTGDSALFVGPAPDTAQFPTAFLEAPVAETASVTPNPLQFPQGVAPRAVSGKRLLMSTGPGAFSLVDNAGALGAAAGAAVTTDAGEVGTQLWAQSADGAVFWLTGVHMQVPQPPPNPPINVTRAVKGYFLIADEAAPVAPNVGLDVEVYNGPVQPAAGAAVLGPLAMLDGKTAMVVTMAKENAGQTAVQFVQKEPLGVIKEGANPKRQVLPLAFNIFTMAAGSNGIGYLVAHDTPGAPAPATSASVYVFDPGCAP